MLKINLNQNQPPLEDSSQKNNRIPDRSLSNCLNKIQLDWKRRDSLAGLWQDWPSIAGKQLAKNCRPLSFQHGTLVIGASHPQWRQALLYNRTQLLSSLKAAGHKVKNIRIQQYYPPKTKELPSEKSIWAKHPSRIDIHGSENCPLCDNPASAGEIFRWGKCGFCERKNISN